MHGQVTPKFVVVYPNSGETWDGLRKEWVESTGVNNDDFASSAPQWVEAGASLMGGCCRTTPKTIGCILSAVHPGGKTTSGEGKAHGDHTH